MNSQFNNKNIKICIIQHNQCSNSVTAAKTVDNILSQLSTNNENVNNLPHIVVLPEDWINSRPCKNIEENPIVKGLQPVIAKYQVYAFLGSLIEINPQKGKKPYKTCPILGKDGNLIGTYRKQYSDNLNIENGDDSCILELEGIGKVGVLICRDVEEESVWEETLKHNPRIIINPTYIPSRSGYFQTQRLDQLYSTWRIACDSMSKRFEWRCKESGTVLVRCDQPVSSATTSMGTSQVIAPHFSIRGPDMFSCWWTVNIPSPQNVQYERYASLLNPPERDRTQRDDNVGNRYTSRQCRLQQNNNNNNNDNNNNNNYWENNDNFISCMKFVRICDMMHVAAASDDEQGIIYINNMHTLLPKGRLNAHNGKITALSASNSSKFHPGYLWSGGTDGMIRLWNIMNQRKIDELNLNSILSLNNSSSSRSSICATYICATPNYIFIGLSNGKIIIFSIHPDRLFNIHYKTLDYNFNSEKKNTIQICKFNSSSKFLILVNSDEKLQATVWDDDEGKFTIKNPSELFVGPMDTFYSVQSKDENAIIVSIFYQSQCRRIKVEYLSNTNDNHNEQINNNNTKELTLNWSLINDYEAKEKKDFLVTDAVGIHPNACLCILHNSSMLWLMTFKDQISIKMCPLYSCSYTREFQNIDFQYSFQKHKAVTCSSDGQVQVWEFIQNAMPQDLKNAL